MKDPEAKIQIANVTSFDTITRYIIWTYGIQLYKGTNLLYSLGAYANYLKKHAVMQCRIHISLPIEIVFFLSTIVHQ